MLLSHSEYMRTTPDNAYSGGPTNQPLWHIRHRRIRLSPQLLLGSLEGNRFRRMLGAVLALKYISVLILHVIFAGG